jgi:ketosteroid isomerase-like protein
MLTPVIPVVEPITGRESSTDLTKPLNALSQCYRAINTRDLGLLAENWEPSPEIVMDNPIGGIRRGWPQIRAAYEQLFGGPPAYTFELWDYTVHQTADAFWVIGRERARVSAPGSPPFALHIRTTRLFRRQPGGRWKQAHHHGSIDDPHALAAFQNFFNDMATVHVEPGIMADAKDEK